MGLYKVEKASASQVQVRDMVWIKLYVTIPTKSMKSVNIKKR